MPKRVRAAIDREIRMLKWLVSLGLVFGATSASAEDLTQNVAHGSINWGKGVVVVTGNGAPSLKAATQQSRVWVPSGQPK